MDQMGEEVYADLYKNADLREFGWVRDVEDRVLEKYKELVIRADAKYFLLVNSVHMIAAPLMKAGKASREQLESELRHDLGLILDVARDEAARAKQKVEVSGHAVLAAVNKLWADLDLMRQNFWG